MICSWYEIDLGSRLGSIDDMCKEAIEIAKLLNTQCAFDFNGVKVCVDRNSKWERVVVNSEDWYDYENQKALRLPPVGVEVTYDGSKYFVVAHHFSRNDIVIAAPFKDSGNLKYLNWQKFSPLDYLFNKDSLIKLATDILYENACATRGELVDGAKALFEAGMLVSPTKRQ